MSSKNGGHHASVNQESAYPGELEQLNRIKEEARRRSDHEALFKMERAMERGVCAGTVVATWSRPGLASQRSPVDQEVCLSAISHKGTSRYHALHS